MFALKQMSKGYCAAVMVEVAMTHITSLHAMWHTASPLATQQHFAMKRDMLMKAKPRRLDHHLEPSNRHHTRPSHHQHVNVGEAKTFTARGDACGTGRLSFPAFLSYQW